LRLLESGLGLRAKSARLAAITVVALLLAFFTPLRAREPGSVVDRMSTQERLDQPEWWPTKLVSSRKDFVGSDACKQCHAAIVATAKGSEMARALLRPEDSQVLRAHEGDSFQLESYVYKLEHAPHAYQFDVKQGTESATQPITWAFGDGTISQVYLTDNHGTYTESHFSYYGGTGGFDRTTNQPHQAETLPSAVGRVMMPAEVRRCFACHSAGVTAEGVVDNVIPGVTCETCHGPGADHVAAMKAKLEGGEALIMNPKRLDRTASVDFCGACHMTWVDVQLGDVTGPPTVRFPAYRLENSKCWAKGDSRITCVGCHDPHQPVQRNAAYYDQKCLSCHLATMAAAPNKEHIGKACPQSDHNCISCHMPKRDFPDTHHSFTDHDIRIVRAGAPAPD
jgi:hypothetical protein